MEKCYKEFCEEDDALKWLNSNYQSFIETVKRNRNTDNTLGNALFCYTGSMSRSYNTYLRANKGEIDNIDKIIRKNDFDDTESNIRLIYDAFDINVIPENIVLYHYIKIREVEGKIKKGSIIQLNKFISTTMLKNTRSILSLVTSNKYNLLIKIKVKKGTSCIPINWVGTESKLREFEIILHPKSKFKILKRKITFSPYLMKVIECELLQ